MDFSDFWDIKTKKQADAFKPGDHVRGHADGDHTWCSARNCKIAQNCINGKHEDCSKLSCNVKADHHAGSHDQCGSNWCTVAKNAWDTFTRLFNEGILTEDELSEKMDSMLITEPDDSDRYLVPRGRAEVE